MRINWLNQFGRVGEALCENCNLPARKIIPFPLFLLLLLPTIRSINIVAIDTRVRGGDAPSPSFDVRGQTKFPRGSLVLIYISCSNLEYDRCTVRNARELANGAREEKNRSNRKMSCGIQVTSRETMNRCFQLIEYVIDVTK